MELPNIYKSNISIDNSENNYYRGSAKEINNDFIKLPMSVKLIYQNREFNTKIVNMTNNYYITKDGNVLFKEDVKIIEKE